MRGLVRRFSELAARQPTPLELERGLRRLKRAEQFEHEVTSMTDLLTKHVNTHIFEDRLLPKQRVLLEPVRLRHPLDSFDHLRTTDHLPGAIFPRGNAPGVDFVLHKSQARALRHIKHLEQRPIFIRLPTGEEVRCLMRRLFISPDQQVYLKATFDRYIVGEPNTIKVRLTVPEGFHPAQRQADIELVHEQIELLSYNDVNPAEVEIDYNRLCRKKRYTLGDLFNTLPAGLEPHPRYKSLDLLLAKVVHAPTRVESDAEHLLETNMEVFEDEAAGEAVSESLTNISSEEQWERAKTATTERRREARRLELDELKKAHPKRFQRPVPLKKKIQADAASFRKKIEEENKRLDQEVVEKKKQAEEEKQRLNRRATDQQGEKKDK